LQAGAAQVVAYYQGKASGTTVVSAVTQHYFVRAATNCNAYGSGTTSNTDCEVLANLCALQFYDDAHPACTAISAIQAARGTSAFTNNVQGWHNALPWLYYANGVSACADTAYSGRASLRYNYLTYMVGVYALDGTFKVRTHSHDDVR